MADRRLIPICASAALRDGDLGQRFDLLAGGMPATGFVVRYRGRVAAFLNRCAHMPMELDWIAGQFFDGDGRYLMCATHGAEYEPDSGRCAGGPCGGRGLAALSVVEREGFIYWEAERDRGIGVTPPGEPEGTSR